MSVEVVRVVFAFSLEREVLVGRLALDGNMVVFEYDVGFAQSGLSINPFFGPVMPGLLHPRNPRAFRGLHGAFADSLPDAWGELLLERQFAQSRICLRNLTILDRLVFIGRLGRGALVYEPASHDIQTVHRVHLDQLAWEATKIVQGAENAILGEMARLGGTSGGARPKVHVALDEAGHAYGGDGLLPPGFTNWMVKFHSSADRFLDVGPLECAYAEIARRAGIDMPRTRLIPAQSGPGYFATERFDRGPNGQRIHMLSIAGMLDAEWNIPSLTYEDVLHTVRVVTRDEEAVQQMYRRMIFNVMALNRDDHAKQHAFLLEANGVWKVSPAYDLTFAAGPGNEHYLSINGRGRDIQRSDLLAVAHGQSLSTKRANEIIEEVVVAVVALPRIARDFGVTRATIKAVARATAGQIQLICG